MADVALGVAVFADGFDLSGYFTSVEVKGDVDIKDNTVLNSTGARTFQPGLASRQISGDGFFAQNAVDDTLSIDKTFNDAMSSTANKLFSVGPKGVTQGYPAILANTKQAKFDVSVKVGELIATKFDAKATLDGSVAAFANGIWLISQVFTGAANGATFDNTSTILTGWFANIHNTNADGTVTGKIQHSVDGTTWVDLVTFTALAKNSATQSVDIGTAVRRYWRVIVTAIGGTTAKVSVGAKIGYLG